MGIKYYPEVEQGGDEWMAMRRGLLTASEMKLIMTPKLKVADNEKSISHVFEIAAQRISGYTEPSYISDDMLQGKEDEIKARLLYEKHIAPVHASGFVTNDEFGFTIGFSPDWLVEDDGFAESKSRRQKFQVETVVADAVPEEHILQVMTGFIVTKRKWCDYISYSGGLPMAPIRVLPDFTMIEAIIRAATDFEAKVQATVAAYNNKLSTNKRLIPTERTIIQEMHL